MNGTPEEQSLPVADTVMIEDLNEFVQLLVNWHNEKVTATQYMLEIPAGTTFTIGDGVDQKEVILVGAALDAFKLGIEMAMMQLGTLPFAAEFEDAPVLN